MHLRPRKKLAAQLKTVWRPVTMRVFYHTVVTKRPNYQNKRLEDMPYQDFEKLLNQREERDKQRWFKKERSADEFEPPTLFRAVNENQENQVIKNHIEGKLWFRSLPHFRKVQDEGKDVSEGIGSYALPDGRICRDVHDETPTAFILSFGEQAEALREFGEYCLEVRNPLELKRRVECRLCPESRVEWRKIKYDKVMDKDNKVMQLEANPGPTESWDLMYYSKPETFAEEKEWRLLIFLPMRLLNETLELHVGDLIDVFRYVAV